jgi:hypothetical protein
MQTISSLVYTLTCTSFTVLIFRMFWFSPHGHRIPFKKIRMKPLLLIPAANTVLNVLALYLPEYVSIADPHPEITLRVTLVIAAYQLFRWWRAPVMYTGALGSLNQLAGRNPPPRSDYVA